MIETKRSAIAGNRQRFVQHAIATEFGDGRAIRADVDHHHMIKCAWGAFEVSLTAGCAQRDVAHALFRRTAVVVQMAIQEFMQCFLECSFDAAEVRVIGAGVGWLVYQFDERVDTSMFLAAIMVSKQVLWASLV